MSTFNTRMTRGQTKIFTMTVRDANMHLVDLTAAKCYFAMRADIKVDASVKLASEATSGHRIGIIIAPDQTGATKGQFTITLIPADTIALVALGDDDPWIYDVWVVETTLGTIPVIEQSTIGLYPQVTMVP